LIGFLLPAVQAARETARRARCLDNLKQIGLATSAYQATLQVLPFGVGGGGPPNYVPRWSAHSQLLPFLEQSAVYHALNFAHVPWSHDLTYSAANETASHTSLSIFLCPSDSDSIPDPPALAHNSYRANAGTRPVNLTFPFPAGSGANDGPFWFQSAVAPAQFRDGLGNTALFSERCLGATPAIDPRADYFLAGTDPESCSGVDPATTPAYLNQELEWSGGRWGDGNIFYTRYHHISTPNRPSCNHGRDDFRGRAVVTASSRHPGGVNLLLADGSARFVRDAIDPRAWQALGTLAGGEVIDAAAWSP